MTHGAEGRSLNPSAVLDAGLGFMTSQLLLTAVQLDLFTHLGESAEDALFGRLMGSDTITQAFKEARKDDSIQAVVFRINSPGGSDVASDVIWREAFLTMAEKPVIVSMSDVAASGGYWIATASHAIVAEPTTLTGSIGILSSTIRVL